MRQVPNPADHRRALISLLTARAGTKGEALGKARRALRELLLFQPEHCFPASALLINCFLAFVAQRDTSAKQTAARTVRGGLLTLQQLGLPIDLSMADAVARPVRYRAHPRQAGSLPIQVYCHMEMLAAEATPSIVRTYARSLVVAWLFSRLRMIDILRATISVDAQEEDGTVVIVVHA